MEANVFSSLFLIDDPIDNEYHPYYVQNLFISRAPLIHDFLFLIPFFFHYIFPSLLLCSRMI